MYSLNFYGLKIIKWNGLQHSKTLWFYNSWISDYKILIFVNPKILNLKILIFLISQFDGWTLYSFILRIMKMYSFKIMKI